MYQVLGIKIAYTILTFILILVRSGLRRGVKEAYEIEDIPKNLENKPLLIVTYGKNFCTEIFKTVLFSNRK